MKNIAIIGFGTAGLRAALSARSQDPSANVTVISEEKYLTYSRCGLPFVLSGEIKSFDDLFVISKHTLARSNINLLLGFRVVDIIGNTLYIENDKESKQLHFDSIIFATGSRVSIPPINGVNLNNVFTLRNIDDGLKIINSISNIKHIVIVGAGAIGLECAEAFYKRGLSITIVELMPRILPNILDEDMAKIVQERIINSNIKLIVGKKIEEIYGSSVVEGVSIDGENIPCDAVLIATGVKANVNLAKNIGLNIGTMGIKTNTFQETSKESIYAAGDCAETRHIITSKPYNPYLGTVAYRQGNVAGINAAGGSAIFQGALGSTVLKVFDMEVGFTGLTSEQAEKEGFDIIVSKVKWYTKAEYYPSHGEITVKLLFDAVTQKLIGGQIVGNSDVAQRINILAALISFNARPEDIIKIDTCYSPPLADTIEPIIRAAELSLKRFKR